MVGSSTLKAAIRVKQPSEPFTDLRRLGQIEGEKASAFASRYCSSHFFYFSVYDARLPLFMSCHIFRQ